MYAKKRNGNKLVVTLIAMALLMGCAVGGTLAWLVTKTDPVVNTFTPSNISIKLTESANLDLKMVPGADITKDPKVQVLANSEACWLFVKLEKSANFDQYMTYDMAAGWTIVNGENNVYSRKHDATGNTDGEPIGIIANNKVSVNSNVTKDMMTAANNAQPTLTVTAYAVQQTGFDAAANAWTEAKKLDSSAN